MNRIDWQRIGWKVSDMRRSRNMTQQELAEKMGVTDVYIGYLEQGKRHGPLETYIRIVNILGYTMDDLLEEYMMQPLPLSSAQNKSLAEECTPEEREVIQRMALDLMSFFRRQRCTSHDHIINPK